MAYIQTVYNTAAHRFRLASSNMGVTLFEGRRFSVLTAANPFSRQLSDDENAVRNLEMKLEIEKMDYDFDWSYGEQSDHSWREDGFVIFDAPLEVMLELGRKFEQNAILHGVDSKVALAWCDNEKLEWFFARLELD
jgi:Protein of unknown function (DUF3293)